jgi:hypothetical protein
MGRIFDALTYGPTRRRRQMNRRLAQLDAAYRTGIPLERPARRRFERAEPAVGASPVRLFAVLALIVAAVVGSVVAVRAVTGSDPLVQPEASPTPARAPDRSPSASRPTGSSTFPPAGVESSPERLLPAVSPPPGTGGYAFTSRNSQGVPITYDPCRPIHYVVRDDGTPPGGDEAIRAAVAAVSTATGLRFIDDGSSDEAPDDNRRPFQPERYGQRWAPVLLAWSNPRETHALTGPTTGTGGSRAVTVTDRGSGASETAYVTGSVVLDAPQLRASAAVEGRATTRAVVEHELGHLVGLAHVDDKSQLMYPEAGIAVLRYQAGDLRGLARLGAGPCTPTL